MEMEAVLKRLESVASRLEATEGRLSSTETRPKEKAIFTPPKFSVALPGLATPGKPVARSKEEEVPPACSNEGLLASWDAEVQPALKEFSKAAQDVGGDVRLVSLKIETCRTLRCWPPSLLSLSIDVTEWVRNGFAGAPEYPKSIKELILGNGKGSFLAAKDSDSKAGVQAERTVVEAISQCQKPDQAGLSQLVAPVGAQLQACSTLTAGRRTDAFTHNKALAEASQALVWVVYTGPNSGMSPPAQHVQEAWQSAEFWANKILMEYRNKDPAHVAWVKALQSLLMTMKEYVGQHHPAGPAWYSAGKPLSAFSPAAPSEGAKSSRQTESSSKAAQPPARGPPPPPPPAAGSLLQKRQAGAVKPSPTAGLSAVFSEINKQGDGVTHGLRKVTDDMKTRNRTARTGMVSGQPSAAPATSTTAKAKAMGPPRIECEQGRKWIVENQEGNQEIVIDDTSPKQTVYVYRCRNCTVQVKGKVNALTIDECTKSGVVFDDVVASCELVNSSSMQVQVTGVVPTLAVEKCDGIQLYLSKPSVGCPILTAKSSSVNVLVPGKGDEDMAELYVPEQFVSTVKNGQLITEPVSHSGG